MAVFEKLRISLAREEPGPMIEASGHQETFRSRADFLAVAFGRPRDFLHRKTSRRFGFTPISAPEGYVAGLFTRERPLHARKKDLRPYDAENYESSLFILSLDKAQIAWMEANYHIGSTKVLLESFFEFLSKKSDLKDWKAYVEYIDTSEDYWNVIERRRHEIAKISFTFIPPNALSADDKVYNLIKEVRIEANPDTQQHIYRSEPGQMNPATPIMEASARIAMQGGGEAEVRNQKHKILYSSRRSRTTAEMDREDASLDEMPEVILRAIAWLYSR